MCVLFVHVDARCVVRPHRVHGAFFTDSEGGFGFLFLYDFFFKSASVAIGMALSGQAPLRFTVQAVQTMIVQRAGP